MENQLIISILICYFALLSIIGILSSKKIKNSKGFYLAGRNLGTLPLTATITATVVGGSATIASAKLIYLNGLPSLWLDIGAATGLIILGLALASLVRKTKLYTLPEITGFLFDKKVRYAAAFLIIITQIAWISLLIQGTGAILAVLFSVEYQALLAIITLIFILYTILGGQYAVVYTDIIQFFVMIVGVCAIATPLLLMKASPMFSEIPASKLEFPINSNIGLLPAVSFFFMMLMPHIVGPDIYSKILSAKNEKIAKKATLYSGLFRIIFAICIALISLSAIVLIPDIAPEKAILAMPMAIKELGPILAGVILAAFVSVMLSSADSVLISSGAVLSIDIANKKSIIISRIGMIFIGLSALVLALYLNDIIKTLQLAYTVFTSGLTFPIIFGFFKEKTKVTPTGALVSLILGGSTSLVWFFMDNPYRIDAIIIGMIFSILPLILLREGLYARKNPKSAKN